MDEDFVDFMDKLDCYLKEQHDAHVEDVVVDGGAIRIYVKDAHNNDIVWTLRSIDVEMVLMTTIIENTDYQCKVSLQPWAVGAILMS